MKYPNIHFNEELARNYTGNITQLGGLCHSVLQGGKARGCEVVDFSLGNGLAFTVFPGRGMVSLGQRIVASTRIKSVEPNFVQKSLYETQKIKYAKLYQLLKDFYI